MKCDRRWWNDGRWQREREAAHPAVFGDLPLIRLSMRPDRGDAVFAAFERARSLPPVPKRGGA